MPSITSTLIAPRWLTLLELEHAWNTSCSPGPSEWIEVCRINRSKCSSGSIKKQLIFTRDFFALKSSLDSSSLDSHQSDGCRALGREFDITGKEKPEGLADMNQNDSCGFVLKVVICVSLSNRYSILGESVVFAKVRPSNSCQRRTWQRHVALQASARVEAMKIMWLWPTDGLTRVRFSPCIQTGSQPCHF